MLGLLMLCPGADMEKPFALEDGAGTVARTGDDMASSLGEQAGGRAPAAAAQQVHVDTLALSGAACCCLVRLQRGTCVLSRGQVTLTAAWVAFKQLRFDAKRSTRHLQFDSLQESTINTHAAACAVW